MPLRFRTAGAVALTVLLVRSPACGDAAPAFGITPAEARANSGQFFRSLAVRVTSVQRDSAYEYAREQLARHALSPSRLYANQRVWTSSSTDSLRMLVVRGRFIATGTAAPYYRFSADPSTPTPAALGDSRRVTRLRRDGDGEYTWFTDVAQAMGPIGAADLARATTSWLGAAAQRRPDAIRADYRTHFPRTSAHLATLFALDSLDVRPLADGSSTVALHVRLRPEGLTATYPFFERYVRKYVEPLRFRFTLTDRSAAPATFFDVRAGDGSMVIRYRARAGHLVPLTGAARPMPDTLRLEQDLFIKFGPFTVGATDLVSEVTIERSPGVRAWSFRWRREPDWHFPLAVDALISSPLRHPFEGEGTLIRLSLEDQAGHQTLMTRQARVSVRESALVRWLGGLGSDAMSDFSGKAEAEENRWLATLFWSLRADMLSALSVACAAPPSVECEPAN